MLERAKPSFPQFGVSEADCPCSLNNSFYFIFFLKTTFRGKIRLSMRVSSPDAVTVTIVRGMLNISKPYLQWAGNALNLNYNVELINYPAERCPGFI